MNWTERIKNNENWLIPISIALMLCACYLPYPVSGGENQYLAMAKQFMYPDWIPNSFTLTEFPGSRVVFQYIFGWPLKYMSIESAARFYRVINFFLVAFPLYKVLKHINLKNVTILLLIQVFLTGQNQLGGEWMIGTFEPKTVSYVFFLWAFWFWLRKWPYKMLVAGVLACYFHIIVGGWFFIGLGLVSLFQNHWKHLLKPAVLAVVLLAPFVLYLSPLLLADGPVSDPSADYIYAYYRLPNHLGIATSMDYFISHHLKKTIITTVLFVLSFALQSKIKPELRPWIRVGFGISLFYVGIAMLDSFYLDKQASFGLKYYPFRLNSFAYFLVITSVFVWVQQQLESRRWDGSKWLFLLAIGLMVGKGIDSSRSYLRSKKSIHPELDEWVLQNTEKTDVFLLDIIDFAGPYNKNFIRLSERENYAVDKFVPAEKTKIIEWYRRQKVLVKIVKSKKYELNTLQQEGINFIISEKKYASQIPLFTANNGWNVYKVID